MRISRSLGSFHWGRFAVGIGAGVAFSALVFSGSARAAFVNPAICAGGAFGAECSLQELTGATVAYNNIVLTNFSTTLYDPNNVRVRFADPFAGVPNRGGSSMIFDRFFDNRDPMSGTPLLTANSPFQSRAIIEYDVYAGYGFSISEAVFGIGGLFISGSSGQLFAQKTMGPFVDEQIPALVCIQPCPSSKSLGITFVSQPSNFHVFDYLEITGLGQIDTMSQSFYVVPEPSSLLSFGLGLFGLAVAGQRGRARAP